MLWGWGDCSTCALARVNPQYIHTHSDTGYGHTCSVHADADRYPESSLHAVRPDTARNVPVPGK